MLPLKRTVESLIPEIAIEEVPLDGAGAVLFRGQTYLVHCGSVELPPGLSVAISPKSSIGRIDLMVRAIVDYEDLYDCVPAAVAGKDAVRRQLWLEITPQSFNVRMAAGDTLTQLMVFVAPGCALDGVAPLPPKEPEPLLFDRDGRWARLASPLSLPLPPPTPAAQAAGDADAPRRRRAHAAGAERAGRAGGIRGARDS